MKELLLFIIFFFLLYLIYTNEIYEHFNVTFATPPDTSSKDIDNIKNLLEIGSQADEDKKYDVVSKKILGKINRVAPKEEIVEPEDPKCFNDNYDFDYDSLKKYQIGSNQITACCDKPSKKEIDLDWNFLQESLDFDFNLDFGFNGDGGEMPNCCGNN